MDSRLLLMHAQYFTIAMLVISISVLRDSIVLFINNCLPLKTAIRLSTERGGSVVKHETRIREVPGSNPGADQPDWQFPQSSRQMLGWIFITTIYLTIIHPIHISHKSLKNMENAVFFYSLLFRDASTSWSYRVQDLWVYTRRLCISIVVCSQCFIVEFTELIL